MMSKDALIASMELATKEIKLLTKALELICERFSELTVELEYDYQTRNQVKTYFIEKAKVEGYMEESEELEGENGN